MSVHLFVGRLLGQFAVGLGVSLWLTAPGKSDSTEYSLNICQLPGASGGDEVRVCDPDGNGGIEPFHCRVGCFIQERGVGDCQDSSALDRYFSTQFDPMWAWLPPDFPPVALNAYESTSPLVSDEVRHFRGPMPHAIRPVDRGLIDLITGSRVLREVDFELPFGSAVFRHIRTNTDTLLINQGSSDFGGGWGWKARYLADWNGNWWMMGENPLFLFDAQPVFNRGLPRTCYFIPDAHRAIPFVWDENSNRYIAPPWIDAKLVYIGGTPDSNGSWTQVPTEFRVSLNRGSITYVIELLPQMMPECFHAPAINDDWERGVPRIGRVKRIEDRYGNVAEHTYCDGPIEDDCSYTCSEGVCETLCANCNEVGQLKAVKLKRKLDDGSGALETVWTLLYTHRAFGYYCEYCPDPEDDCTEESVSPCEPPDSCALGGMNVSVYRLTQSETRFGSTGAM